MNTTAPVQAALVPMTDPGKNLALYNSAMDAAKKALAKGTKGEKRTYPLRELEIGDSVTAVYWGRKLQGEVIDSNTGEVKERFFIFLADPLKEESKFEACRSTEGKFKMWENGPLHNALVEADVQPGNLIVINRLEKKKMTIKAGKNAGQTAEVNQYEVEVIPL